MTNQDFARTFNLIGDLLELKGENVYKISAYHKAAEAILNSPEPVETLWREGRVKELAGVGDAIAGKIDELLTTGGHLQFLERLEEEIPPDLVTLLKVPGIGTRTAMLLYKHLGIKGLAELEQAARDGRVASVPGMGQKKQDSLLKNIESLNKRDNHKILLGVALPCARQLMLEMMKSDPNVREIVPTGAIRRGEELLDMISIVVSTEDTYETLETFRKLPQLDRITRERDYKLEGVLKNGLPVELIACFPEQLATTLVMTTGTLEHRTQLRDLAWKRGYELSLGGFIKGEEIWPAQDEEEVFRYLGLPYIPPELRRGNGEIQAIMQGEMALDLVTLDDIKGDLHSHSLWSDGTTSIETMARAAATRGYRYLLLTDHTKSLGMVRGLNEEKLLQQQAEIARVNEVLTGEGFNFRLLSGAEVEIKADGSLDFSDEVLASMDIVVASLHSSLRQERARITDRLLRAIHNPHVDIIAHPTGRILNAREPADLNMARVFAAAHDTGTALEINSGPDRLDLKAEHVQQALEAQVKLVISSDAHSPGGLAMLEYGVLTARRGGARATEILNTLELDQLLKSLKG